MVPMTRFTTVGGVSVSELIDQDTLSKIIARTRDAGAEIIKLEQSSAFYAPASAVVRMIDSFKPAHYLRGPNICHDTTDYL